MHCGLSTFLLNFDHFIQPCVRKLTLAVFVIIWRTLCSLSASILWSIWTMLILFGGGGVFANKISKIFKPNNFCKFVLNGVSPSRMRLSSRRSMANVFSLVESNTVKEINQSAWTFHFAFGNSISSCSKIVEMMYRRLNFMIAFWSFLAF